MFSKRQAERTALQRKHLTAKKKNRKQAYMVQPPQKANTGSLKLGLQEPQMQDEFLYSLVVERRC